MAVRDWASVWMAQRRLIPFAKAMTARLTANFVHIGAQPSISADSSFRICISSGRQRTAVDVRKAVFKTVCGGSSTEVRPCSLSSVGIRYVGV